MLFHCENIIEIDLSNFNTFSVEDMQFIFSCCSSLISLNLSNFNTFRVTTMN